MEDIIAAIVTVLPQISDDEASHVAEELMDKVGVEGRDDLQFVEPADLSMMKPIQIRKLIQAWKMKPSEQQHPPSEQQHPQTASPVCPSTSSSSATTANAVLDRSSPVPSSYNPNWSRVYSIPWNQMSKVFLNTLENGERPQPPQRRNMVSILVEDIRRISTKPTKSQLSHIAAKIVAKYPASFKDTIGGHVLGTGHDSLLKNLTERAGNQNRDKSGSRKRAAASTGNETRQQTTNDYGCVTDKYDPQVSAEATEELLAQKEMMKTSCESGETSTVQENMKLTYDLQRQDILTKELTIPEIMCEWPGLFREDGMLGHFEELVGINIRKSIDNSYKAKGNMILDYMRQCGKKRLQTTIADIDRAIGELGNKTPEIPGLLLLVMKYFEESHEHLFVVMETTANKDDVDKKVLPSTPVLISCGDTLLSRRFMLGIDGHVCNDEIQTFTGGLAMLFAAYYVFGIQYNSETAATMDFIQRCLLHINPDKGTKVEKKIKNQKQHATTNPRVLSLINGVRDQWTA